MTFLRRLVALFLVIGALKAVLAATSIISPPWTFFVELVLFGLIVLHKWSVPIEWISGSTGSPLNRFLRSAVVYFVPASILWGLLSAVFFQAYLPQVKTPFPQVVMLAGIYVMAQMLLRTEIQQLQRPRQ